jgi:flagellar hook-associated protein 1 FlgK
VGNLFAAISTAANSLAVYERALTVTGNNVANASTPGYARQSIAFSARRMDLEQGLPGGVSASGFLSSRQGLLEQSVRRQVSAESRFDQQARSLESLEPHFTISASSGIAASFDALQRSISQWSVTPNDLPARQNVLRGADEVTRAFRQTAGAVGEAANQADFEMQSVVAAINRLTGLMQGFNRELRHDFRNQQDPGLDAQIHATLEELAGYADFTVLRSGDGSYDLYLGGQTPVVVGEHVYPVSLELGAGAPVLRDAQGRDITGQVSDGRLRALIDLRQNFLPGVLADLNRLAETAADTINGILAGGVDLNGLPPALGLFEYDAQTGAAASLRTSALLPEELAGARPEAPGGNAVILDLAQAFSTRNIDNFTLTEFYGQLSGQVGRGLALARQNHTVQKSLVVQARSIRNEQSGVSLDEEAANLIAFQRSYEAMAQMIRILDEMTREMIDIVR